MKQLLIALCVALAAYLWRRWESANRLNRVEKAFDGRRDLTPEEFWVEYFESTGVPPSIVLSVRQLLSEELDADLARLSAHDSFATNLNFLFEFDSMVDVSIVSRLEKEFGIAISDAEAENAKTVSDIVHLVHNKTRSRDAA